MKDQGRNSLVEYRIKRAKETLDEIAVLTENELWNTAVNRIYYACYYAVMALLIKNKIATRSHAGARQMFGLHFIKPGIISQESGKFFSDVFDMRLVSDYDDFIDYKREDVEDLINPARHLVGEIEALIYSQD